LSAPELFSASLRAFHPEDDANKVVALFGLKPKIMQSVGDARQNPSGAHLDGRYTRTYVSFPLEVSKLSTVEAFIQEQLTQSYLADEEKLQAFVTSSGRIEFFLGVFCREMCGIDLAVDLLSPLVKRRISLALDIYVESARGAPRRTPVRTAA
jgi:hypothetical protein